MFVAGRINSASVDTTDIPEWKKQLIMRKRSAATDESKTDRPNGRRGTVLRSTSENERLAEPETVIRTIGNIKVELRSVYKNSGGENCLEEDGIDRYLTSPLSEPSYHDSDEEEDLQYGPGIVDRLKARFSNLGHKHKRKPAVRKFSSLENLPGSRGGGARKFLGFRSNNSVDPNHKPCASFKKAQSMETLLVGGASRIFARSPRVSATSPSRYTDQNSDPTGTECNRQTPTSNINQNELPKPYTVKHFKRMFESPSDHTCNALVNQSPNEKGARSTCATSIPVFSTKSPTTSNQPPFQDFHHHPTNSRAKSDTETFSPFIHNGPLVENFEEISEETSSPESVEDIAVSPAIIGSQHGELIADSTPPAEVEEEVEEREEETLTHSDVSEDESAKEVSSEEQVSVCCKADVESLTQVIESPTFENDDDVAPQSPQGSQVFTEPERADQEEESYDCVTYEPHLEGSFDPQDDDDEEDSSASSPLEMVIAFDTDDGGHQPSLKKPTWQKPPAPQTSIVFDFRGKDVKPQISLGPAPFGCKPAKVKKRTGSPPRDNNGSVSVVNGDHDYEDYDDDDWDQMDIGADLPAISGIVFAGENVKVGKGALLENRNKQLSIQFNDDAMTTYEYPCESPSPLEENGFGDHHSVETDSNVRPNKSSFAISNSPANTALSNYTPHTLSSADDFFQLGMTPPPPPTHRRPLPPIPTQEAKEEESSNTDAIVPADPEDSTGWSSAETADILF